MTPGQHQNGTTTPGQHQNGTTTPCLHQNGRTTPAQPSKMDLGERKALWESLVCFYPSKFLLNKFFIYYVSFWPQVRLVEEGECGENGEDALVLERLGCGSRLSNISAIMEMFGEQVHSHCL